MYKIRGDNIWLLTKFTNSIRTEFSQILYKIWRVCPGVWKKFIHVIQCYRIHLRLAWKLIFSENNQFSRAFSITVDLSLKIIPFPHIPNFQSGTHYICTIWHTQCNHPANKWICITCVWIGLCICATDSCASILIGTYKSFSGQLSFVHSIIKHVPAVRHATDVVIAKFDF